MEWVVAAEVEDCVAESIDHTRKLNPCSVDHVEKYTDQWGTQWNIIHPEEDIQEVMECIQDLHFHVDK